MAKKSAAGVIRTCSGFCYRPKSWSIFGLLMVETRRIELLSESIVSQTSPSAVCDLI